MDARETGRLDSSLATGASQSGRAQGKSVRHASRSRRFPMIAGAISALFGGKLAANDNSKDPVKAVRPFTKNGESV